ncbi:hypothetical protein AGR3A_Cc250044 [Agrobacterium tomkonis CFBP 6623]|uniref:Uncharacterized protein n=1 Tax=Agrobacterium tomkonis CFBP 6623 TaxID=1183432 RepID=A0A1S7PCM0_9HYPH|nr:hypothetical protein AGR3A_Cc250044 [Agrobacterium tomkonis CFBP 6623]
MRTTVIVSSPKVRAVRSILTSFEMLSQSYVGAGRALCDVSPGFIGPLRTISGFDRYKISVDIDARCSSWTVPPTKTRGGILEV